jgi:hypothetical protein
MLEEMRRPREEGDGGGGTDWEKREGQISQSYEV